jgi:hypothetical protein
MDTLPPADPIDTIAFTTVAHGQQDGPKTAKEEVIGSHAAYTAFFDGSPPDSSDVNWDEEIVVAVALGERRTGGYSVEITRIALTTIGITAGTVFISYVERTPEDGAPDVLTYPYHAVKCRRAGIRYFFDKATNENRALCTATYRAQHLPGTVIISAEGVHGTTGYQVFFEQSPIRIFPPQFSLWHIEPTGIVGQGSTPFAAQVSFPATDPVARVTVHDATGAHEVPVEQVSDGGMPHAEVVAIRTQSGGFVGLQETLTVHVDGTLHLVERRLNRNEMRQVPQHHLHPLQDAFARSEWHDVERFYGQPIPDGFTIGITGGGIQTGFAAPSSTPVVLPPILNEVVAHLAALWPSDDVLAEPPRITTDDLPPELFKHWLHAHEEDTDDVQVYRPSEHAFPPSRGRTGFEIKANGAFMQYAIGPNDVPQPVPGRWHREGAQRIRVDLEGEAQRSLRLTIVSVDNQVLRVRQE